MPTANLKNLINNAKNIDNTKITVNPAPPPRRTSRDSLRLAAGFLRFKLDKIQGKTSECVRNIQYNELSETLTVEFQARGTYQYFNVPISEAAGFISSSSKGTYFNLHIRDRYNYERVSA
jgi:lysyl-tRNA synthetase class 2